MPRRLTLLCIGSLLLSGLPLAAQAGDPVHTLTSELPPMAMANSPDGPGALQEMVAELGRRTGVRFGVTFVPWRRAVMLSTSTPRTAIFPLSRSSDRETRYRWLAPLHHETYLFLSLKGSSFDSTRPGNARQRRIGVLRGSVMTPYMREHGYLNMVEASSVAEAMRFLQRGIVEAVLGDRDSFNSSLKDEPAERYVMSEPLRHTTTWLGGSLDFSDADEALFQHAMKQMIDDGTHGRILRKYHLRSDQ